MRRGESFEAQPGQEGKRRLVPRSDERNLDRAWSGGYGCRVLGMRTNSWNPFARRGGLRRRLGTGLALVWAVVLVLGAVGGEAASGGLTAVRTVETVPPPPLESKTLGSRADLGVWNDVHTSPDLDRMFLRRGDTLFAYAPGSTNPLTRIVAAPELSTARIVASTRIREVVWLFFEGHGVFPWAYEVGGGKRVEFRIPGLELAADESLQMQSVRSVPHAGGAMVMLSGGHPGRWPRPANRPVYFWMDLRSGAMRLLPIGYDLRFFAGDETRVGFGTIGLRSPLPPPVPGSEPDRRREGASSTSEIVWMDLATGKDVRVDPLADSAAYWMTFDWTRHSAPAPVTQGGLWGNREFRGVSVAGEVWPIRIPGVVRFGAGWLADARDGWVAFAGRNVSEGAGWLGSPKSGATVWSLGTNVWRFELLEAGRCVTVEGSQSRGPRFWETAWLTEAGQGRRWKILEGVSDLPALPEPKSYVEDRMTVTLVRGVGNSSRPRGVICLFDHARQDMRAHVVASDPVSGSRWQALLLVTGDGRRYRLGGVDGSFSAKRVWYHQAGTLVLGDVPPEVRASEIRLVAHELPGP